MLKLSEDSSDATSYSHSSDEDVAMSEHKTIYEFTVKDADGKDVSLSKYKGQVVIVVNVASKCGYTQNHYTELKALQDKYYDQGLRVAAFPCNQFGGQEPSCEVDILKFVKDTFNYEPDLYAKVKVNGADADPFWQFLKKEQGGTITNAIKWNFTKFLINRKGHVVKRYAPTTSPNGMTAEIEQLLSESP
ncbi:Glutathione peroxidase [Trichostrongylus colubriformis]|uniref:Glutathione peroxidase n=1 Tax=Trichostrongylus colubriformis TaxID=6319 RepID=A0AAN8IQL0_TRICO